MPDSPCAKCPLLDLGREYEKGDPNDPWRRMPELFQASQRLFGNAMMNRQGRTRLRLEKLMGHWCRRMRERHGLCTQKRARLCRAILAESIAHGHKAPPGQQHAYVTQALKTAVNDQGIHDRMKQTRVTSQPVGDLTLPPITFRRAA